ncbi:anti-phage dCTP deaminase [Flavobacterium sp. C4GT6]|uniref:anti-phage dCTP deaminase n=1 Tax=Flavobacterium sp. C4GT6 TaxID=3103818 RepID=UPI002ED574E9
MEAAKTNHTQNTQEDKNISKDKNTSTRVKETFTEEIVLGICSQIGSKKKLVLDEIENYLKEFDYSVQKIKLSDFFESEIQKKHIQNGKTENFSKLAQKIETGNNLRNENGTDYLANLAITKIASQKKNKFSVTGEEDITNIKSQRICYIIDSIKHMDELNTFKDIYKDIFYLMSIYTPKEERVTNLSIPNLSQKEAEDLIDKDQHEEIPNGQQVREVFVNADFFFRVDKNTESEVKNKVKRYINLIFGSDIETPTIEERAMYEAKSASVNSACLSRQVGASIICKEGSLISTGWNDVPKFGGNLYTCESKNDKRCFVLGYCSNDNNKLDLMNYITNEFKNKLDLNKIFPTETKIEPDKNFVVKENLATFIKDILEDSGIKSLIEFSRSVHAEMHAIINAGHLNGNKIKGGTLFCTTYPCHNCARHIIAAGIEKVYYIEPYIKSKAPQLHDDSITEKENIKNKVQLLVFDGVSPRRYLTFFNQNRERKKSGKSLFKNIKKKDLSPINNISLQALFYLETQAAKRITDRKENETKA